MSAKIRVIAVMDEAGPLVSASPLVPEPYSQPPTQVRLTPDEEVYDPSVLTCGPMPEKGRVVELDIDQAVLKKTPVDFLAHVQEAVSSKGK